MPPTEPTPDLTLEEYVLQLEADRDRLTARVAEVEGSLASLGDCINLALREANKDHAQVTDYLGDMRPAVNELVYRITELTLDRDAHKFAAEQAMGMATGQAILDERDRLKITVRELEGELKGMTESSSETIADLAEGDAPCDLTWTRFGSL